MILRNRFFGCEWMQDECQVDHQLIDLPEVVYKLFPSTFQLICSQPEIIMHKHAASSLTKYHGTSMLNLCQESEVRLQTFTCISRPQGFESSCPFTILRSNWTFCSFIKAVTFFTSLCCAFSASSSMGILFPDFRFDFSKNLWSLAWKRHQVL